MGELARDGLKYRCSGVRSGPPSLVRLCRLARTRPRIPAPARTRKNSLFEGAELKREASWNRCSGVRSAPHVLVRVCPLARTGPRIREPAHTADKSRNRILHGSCRAPLGAGATCANSYDTASKSHALASVAGSIGASACARSHERDLTSLRRRRREKTHFLMLLLA